VEKSITNQKTDVEKLRLCRSSGPEYANVGVKGFPITNSGLKAVCKAREGTNFNLNYEIIKCCTEKKDFVFIS